MFREGVAAINLVRFGDKLTEKDWRQIYSVKAWRQVSSKKDWRQVSWRQACLAAKVGGASLYDGGKYPKKLVWRQVY